MVKLEETLKKHGLSMPQPAAKGGVYESVKDFGSNFCYLSGCLPVFNGEQKFTGKLGKDLSLEQGQEAARYCALNILAHLQAKYGSLDKVKRLVKLLVFVACADDFYQQPLVANGASQLFVDIFGEEAGCAARSAIGTNVLPRNAPVEIEVLVELHP
ncbi:MAG: RidA family protein [Spirochaetes bacterium]|nr:RidA family protein [Spirochaetota bacterium]